MAEPSVATLLTGLLNPNQARQATSARDLAMGEMLANAPSGRASLLFAPQQVTAAGRLGRRLAGQDPRTQQEIEAEENRTMFQKLSQEAQQRFPNDRTGQLNFLADQLNAQGKVVEAQKARALAQQSQLTSAQIASEQALTQKRQAETDQVIAEEQQMAQRIENTSRFLEGRGNTELAEAVRLGVIPPQAAVDSAMKPGEVKVVGKSLVRNDGTVLYSAPPEPKEQFKVLSAEEAQERGFPAGAIYQENLDTGEIKATSGGAIPQFSAPPKDYQLVTEYDENNNPSYRMKVIPGSATEKQLQENIKASEAGLRNKGNKVNVVTSTIDETLSLIEDNPDVAGTMQGALVEQAGRVSGGILSAGSDRVTLLGQLETIKANIGFDRLQSMREESPTGGALGQVAIQELVALQSSIANLNPNLPVDKLKFNLERVKGQYESTAEAVANAYTDEQLREKGLDSLIQYRTKRINDAGEIVELPARDEVSFDVTQLDEETQELWQYLTDEEKRVFGWTPEDE